MRKIKILIFFFISVLISGCSESQIDLLKKNIGIDSSTDNIYGKYAYISNTENIKMNGVIRLSYEKKSGGDFFYGSVDVDKTINGIPESCDLNGELLFVEKNTYTLKNNDGAKPFRLMLKINKDEITVTGEIDSTLCNEKIIDAVFQKYNKVD